MQALSDVPKPKEVKELAIKYKKELKKAVQFLKKQNPRKLDDLIHFLHDEAFEKIDCLDCANCCSSISPMISDKDIQGMAKALRMKPHAVTAQYLDMDDENDYVFKQTPCPFLGHDHYCSIYSERPKACSEYPHTDRRKFFQILDLSLKNASVCPVVYYAIWNAYCELKPV